MRQSTRHQSENQQVQAYLKDDFHPIKGNTMAKKNNIEFKKMSKRKFSNQNQVKITTISESSSKMLQNERRIQAQNQLKTNQT